jgi:hypothetical protein
MQYGAIPESLAERIALATGLVPIPLLDTMFGMLKARFVMAGVRLGIFEALNKGPQTATQLAASLQLDGDSLELLLRSLVFADYLETDGQQFSLSPLGHRSMVNGSAKDLTAFVQWNYTQWEFTTHLETLLRTGQGVEFHSTMTDPEAWGHYQKAMLEGARFNAATLAKHVPVRRGAMRLLDLAGSHGLMGAAICKKHPPLKATVIDLPAAVEHARALAEAAGIGALVEHRTGDVLTTDFGPGWDVVLLSNILHHFKPKQIAELLSRVYNALTAEGTVAIWEIERPRPGSKPSGGDGVALFFRLTSTAAAYSGEEYAEWLAAAGFSRVKIVRPRFNPGSVAVHARK